MICEICDGRRKRIEMRMALSGIWTCSDRDLCYITRIRRIAKRIKKSSDKSLFKKSVYKLLGLQALR